MNIDCKTGKNVTVSTNENHFRQMQARVLQRISRDDTRWNTIFKHFLKDSLIKDGLMMARR